MRPPPANPADDARHRGPDGHSEIVDTRGSAHGVVTTLTPPPVKGAYPIFPLAIPASSQVDLGRDVEHRSPHSPHTNWVLPKLDFPQFDGENPQFWKTICEKYFDVYGVQPDLWVRVATLHFSGTAARWLQVHEAHSTPFTWDTLCTALCAKFGSEQYQTQLRQFNTMCQSGSIVEYMEQFEELMHHLLAHNPSFDPLFFTTQFLDGLKHEIKSGVALYRPQELDTAFSLALLQEELLGQLPWREPVPGRHLPRPVVALGAPLPRPGLPAPLAAADDRCALDAARAEDRRQDPARGEDRVAALRNYGRARGLCLKCGECWGHGHQCAAMVQLHVVEELLELLQAKVRDRQDGDSDSDEEQLMSISKLATTGETTPRTVRLLGNIGGLDVLLLVDSGSSHSFISEAVAARMPGQVQQMRPVSVKIADGGTLSCFGYIPACRWETQHQTFTTDVRVLSLGCCDMVVGMDWLEACGPMLIDWSAKTLQFQHNGHQIQLTGLQVSKHQVAPATLDQLLSLEQTDSIAHVICVCVCHRSEQWDR